MTGFYMKRNTGLKWVNSLNLFKINKKNQNVTNWSWFCVFIGNLEHALLIILLTVSILLHVGQSTKYVHSQYKTKNFEKE